MGGIRIPKEYVINEQIRSRQVLVIDDKGTKLGTLTLEEAMDAARERNLDLVEVASQSDPPVCRLMDYGKFRYEQSKKEREARRTQKSNLLSEVRLRPKIGQHDMDFKARKIREFLEEGDKVRVYVMFRGREITHPELGARLLGKIVEQVEGMAMIDSPPRMEGRTMSMILAPSKARLSRDGKSKKVQEANAEAQDT